MDLRSLGVAHRELDLASRHSTDRTEARSKPETSPVPGLIRPTQNPEEPVALRVDFNEFVLGQDWHELKKLSLENGDDNNVIGEGFAWHVHRLASGTHGYGYADPAALQAWVRVVINGVDTGVYVSPEMRDKRFMENRDLYVEGATWLYEVEDKNTAAIIQQEGPPQESPATESLCYEPFAVIPSCALPSDVATSLPGIVDMAGLLTLMAGDAFVVNPDGTLTNGKNFYFVDFLSGAPRIYFPWDLDATPQGNAGSSIYAPRRSSEYAVLLDVPEFRAQYGRIWNDLVCGPWSVASLHGFLDAVEPVISAAVNADPNNQLDGNAAGYFDTLRNFVTNRVAHAIGEIEDFEPCPSIQLEINEVMASNATLEDPDEPGEFPDWFEIRNPTAVAVDVGGVYVTDDPAEPTKYEIPGGVMIPAGGYLLMYADDDGTQGPMHTNFKLAAGGETLQLYDTDGLMVLDSVTFGPQTTGVSFGRHPNGSGPWDFLGAPTPGAANGPHNPPPVVAATGHRPRVPHGDSEVFVSAEVSDDSAIVSVTLHYDAGSGETTRPMQDDGADADAIAGDGVYASSIPALPEGSVVRFWVTATDDLGATTTHPLPAPSVTHTYVVGYEPPPLVVNELMAQNESSIEDPQEPLAYEDWLEIYNAGSQPVSLDGMYISDDPLNPTKFAFPVGLVVPERGHLLLWADANPLQGSSHLGFKLGASGEAVGIYESDARGNLRVDGFAFGMQAVDTAWSRCPDGHEEFVALAGGSPGDPNLGAPGCPGGEIKLFSGVPEGGEIRITIDGVLVSVTIVAGQSLESALRALAEAIEADSSLAAAGTTASALGPQLSTNGSIDDLGITDPGVGAEGASSPAPIPAMQAMAALVAAGLLVLVGARSGRASSSLPHV